MSNFSNIDISHYKVLTLPLRPEPNAVYYVLDQNTNTTKGYIITKDGVAIPLFGNNGGGGNGNVESVTGTGVTGTPNNPKVDIATFVSNQLGNLVHISTIDGKLIVNPITSQDNSITIVESPTEINIQIAASILDQIYTAIHPGDNVSILINDAGYITSVDIEDKEDATNKVDVISGTSSIEYPTENAVVDYVTGITDLKANDDEVLHTTGDEVKEGNLTLNDILYLPTLTAPPTTFNNLGVDDTGAVISIPTEISSTGSIKVVVTNKTGNAIQKGSAVYINGAQGSKATIDFALADSNVITSAALGLVEANIPDNASGYVITSGEALSLNTSAFANGDKVYLSPTTPGGLVNIVPTSPNNVVFIGTVTNSHSTQGKILINIVYTTKLDRLVDVAITSPIDGQMLTYDSTTGLWINETSSVPDATTTEKGKIKLAGDLAGTANAPTVPLVRYTNATPTPTTIGGISSGTTFNGKTMTEMWDSLLYPELFPSFTNPSNTFTFNSAGIFENGATIPLISFSATFNRGTISPAYGTSGFRAGVPETYMYTGTGLSNTTTSILTDSKSISNYVVVNGSNSWTGAVKYLAGEQPLSSKGNPTNIPYPAGTTSPALSVSLTGLYPVFYLKSSSPITSAMMQTAINNGTASKLVVSSTGTITLPYNLSSQYMAFAYPATSTTKTTYFVTALDTGAIGGLFPTLTTLSVSSSLGYWSNINYKIHTSNLLNNSAANIQFS